MAARKATLVVTVPRRQSGACAVSGKKTGRESRPVFIPGGSDDLRWATRKKRRRDRLIRLARGRPGWAFGFQDEVWFSRLAQPALHTWAAPGQRLRLAMHGADRDDPDAKALACYGLWLPERERMLLRFVAGRPVSAVTCPFLAWVAGRLAAEGVRVLALVWDNAPW